MVTLIIGAFKKTPPKASLVAGGGMPPAHSHRRVAPKAQSEPMARRELNAHMSSSFRRENRGL